MASKRVVSLVPSLTELVFWLGAGERLVGRTKFCTEPAGEVSRVPAFGGTKNPQVDRIVAAEPDLVIANKEENRREDIEALERAGLSVLLTDPNSVEEALSMIGELGLVLEARARAAQLVEEVRQLLAERRPDGAVPVFVAVWHNPLMGLGSSTYGDSVLEASGARNVLAGRERYPELTMDDLRSLRPGLILLPDEPFPFHAGHAALYEAVAPARVIDGKLLWWYGPRMADAIRSLRRILAGEPVP